MFENRDGFIQLVLSWCVFLVRLLFDARSVVPGSVSLHGPIRVYVPHTFFHLSPFPRDTQLHRTGLVPAEAQMGKQGNQNRSNMIRHDEGGRIDKSMLLFLVVFEGLMCFPTNFCILSLALHQLRGPGGKCTS